MALAHRVQAFVNNLGAIHELLLCLTHYITNYPKIKPWEYLRLEVNIMMEYEGRDDGNGSIVVGTGQRGSPNGPFGVQFPRQFASTTANALREMFFGAGFP